jgi:hypothetical protein
MEIPSEVLSGVVGFVSAAVLAIIGFVVTRWITKKDDEPKEVLTQHEKIQALVDRETTDVKNSLAVTIFRLETAVKDHAAEAKASFRELNETLHETREDVAAIRADANRTQKTVDTVQSQLTKHLVDRVAHGGGSR